MIRVSMFALLLSLLLLTACGDDGRGPTDPPATVDLTVTPAAGVAGTPVALEGLDLSDVNPSALDVRFGDAVAVARVQPASGAVVAGAPFLLNSAGGVSTPNGEALDVTVRVDGTIVAVAEAAFTVEAFEPAPGATADLVASYGSIIDDIEAVALALAPSPGLEYGYASALLGAARELLTGDGEGSLASALAELAAADPEALELLDGILAGSGALERTQAVAGQLEALSQTAEPLALLRRTTELTDDDLAMRMQLYVMVRDVGQQVIGETASTWGTWVGTVVGGISFVGVTGPVAAPVVAALGATGTVLGLINTAVNTIALSYLPARIDSFELTADPLVVAPGQVAQTEIWIQASNQPATITTLDLVDLVLNAMGVLPGSMPAGHPRRVALIQTIDYFLGVFRGILSNYAQQVSDPDLTFDVASIPSMTWRAPVDDLRYVIPLSHTPGIIDATGAGILAWRAATDGEGEGRIYARIASGPDVTSLAQIPGYTYTAGAFGDEVLTTETLSINVAPPIVAVASMDPSIAPGGLNGLEIRAGTVGATGDTLWTEGLLVECTATGGTVAPASGLTDADGRFDAFVALDEGSSQVTVDVTVTGDFDQQATLVASANTDVGTPVLSHMDRLVRVDLVVGGDHEFDHQETEETGPWNATATHSLSGSSGNNYSGHTSGNTTMVSSVRTDEEGHFTGIDGVGSASVTMTGTWPAPGRKQEDSYVVSAQGSSEIRTGFLVTDGPRPFTLELDFSTVLPESFAEINIYVSLDGDETGTAVFFEGEAGEDGIRNWSGILPPDDYSFSVNYFIHVGARDGDHSGTLSRQASGNWSVDFRLDP